MELFLLEHKKLWKKRSVQISVLLCYVYVVIFAGVLSFQWFTFGSSDGGTSLFGTNFDGYSVIRDSQEYAGQFGGELTDSSLQAMVRDYQRLAYDGLIEEMGKTDWLSMQSWLTSLWPELKEADSYIMMTSYVSPDDLTGFYERRDKALMDGLLASGKTEEETEYLLNMDAKTKRPYKYEWIKGWSPVVSAMVADLGVGMALIIAIVLSPMFAGEWHDNTGTLLLTTKKGWKEAAAAKILTGLAFAVERFVLLAVSNIIVQLFFLGTEGWDMPVQMIKITAVAHMNMLQAEIYMYCFALLGAIGFAGVVMLISAMIKSNVAALVLSLGIVYGPSFAADLIPYKIQRILKLLPFVGHPIEIFNTNTYNVFGRIIWSPYVLITVPVCIGLLCLPFAMRGWCRKMKV